MNSIPQAVKSQVTSAGKVLLNTGSLSGGTPTFTVKQLSNNKVGSTVSGNSSNINSSPAAFIKLNQTPSTTTGMATIGLNQTAAPASTLLNTAAKIQIQPGGVATAGGAGPIFSMTVNPPLFNSTASGGVKRKADQMDIHN
jgi:hypothetical protein